MTLQFYNTLKRKKDVFDPNPENVRMYVCGPTVYDRAHLGNARSVVVYDVLYRLLRHVYGEKHVTYVRNITDVDDKINAAAKERGITIQALTQEVTGWFHADMDSLNVLRPTKEPKATEHIPQMIAMIEKLIAHGNAYVAEGHVLFSVKSDAKYGQLSGRIQDDLRAGERVKVEAYKRDAGDFVLWKPADAGDDPSSVFQSPWGAGRPGWHIECSAMSTEYLGENFDLHGGGSDLMFPHHENEIAQSCCANPGSTFAKFWVHNGFLTVNGEKMSKSLGNFITVKDLLDKGMRPEVIRYCLLATGYSKPLDWNEFLVDISERLLKDFVATAHKVTSFHIIRKATPSHEEIERLKNIYNSEKTAYFAYLQDSKIRFILHSQAETLFHSFLEALYVDLNTAVAFSHLHEMVRLGKFGEDYKLYFSIKVVLQNALRLLGIDSKNYYEYLEKIEKINNEPFYKKLELAEKGIDIDQLIEDRTTAKAAKNWAEADRIRKELAEQGIILEDKPDGTTDWRRA